MAKISDAPGCLWGWLTSLLGGSAAQETGVLPYKGRDYFFSKAERSFYEVLRRAMPKDYVLFAKVGLGDLLYIQRGTERWQAWRNRIQSKHVDFVLCDPKFLKPILVIELDDSSHDDPDREERDAFVDQALAAGGIPILHVPVAQAYNADELRRLVAERIGPGSAAEWQKNP